MRRSGLCNENRFTQMCTLQTILGQKRRARSFRKKCPSKKCYVYRSTRVCPKHGPSAGWLYGGHSWDRISSTVVMLCGTVLRSLKCAVPCQMAITAQKWDPALSPNGAQYIHFCSGLYDAHKVVANGHHRIKLGPTVL